MTIRTIIAPVDFSTRSAAAAQHAAALALHFDATVLFVHVIEPAPSEHRAFTVGHTTEQESAQLRAAAERALKDFVAKHGVAEHGEAVVLEGDVAHRIEALAVERKAELVVMPTRGAGAFRRLLVGSTAAKVLHDLDCPVMTGAHLDEGPMFPAERYSRICCAIGLREVEHSEKVLRWAWDFTQSWNGSLHVIHVPPALEWAAADWFPPDTQQLVQEAARERLQKLVDKVGCGAEIHVQGLNPESAIFDVIEDVKGDLLILGRSVSHGLFGGLHQDAFSLIRGASCPVVSV